MRSQRINSEFQREISAIISGPLKNKEPEIRGIVSVTAQTLRPI